MNTLQNMIDNGINRANAVMMLDSYLKRIGTKSGVNKIADITYDFENNRKDIMLKCSLCGKEIHVFMPSGVSKWDKVKKTCACQKEAKGKEKTKRIEEATAEKHREVTERVGKTYGDYEVVCIENEEYVLKCKECGAEKRVSVAGFYQRTKFVCKEHNKTYEPVIKFDDSYIGKKNNFLEVVSIDRKNNHKMFLCKCDCGNYKLVEPVFWERGIVKSCGCYAESLKLEHSEELDRLRRIYNGMIQRCYNSKAKAYRNYGGRGIEICDKWLNDREKFIEWALNNGYANDLSIDRIDVNGNYEPSNCRWATIEVQLENRRPKEEWEKPKKRKLKAYEIDGEKKPLVEWYKTFKTSEQAVRYRMKTMGMTFEEALKTPKLTDGRPRKEV